MLVSVDELSARLPFVLDEDETREAEGAIADLCIDAQTLGSAGWTDPSNTPQAVKNLVLRAAARHMKNYEGYIQSRSGDETVQWAEPDVTGQATFSKDEKAMLKQMGGRGSFIGSVGVYAYGSKVRRGPVAVPVDYAPLLRTSDFPMYAEDDVPLPFEEHTP